jgi:hypothetical protein
MLPGLSSIEPRCLGLKREREFHQACDGRGKFVVVVRAENGRIAVAYNEDSFSSPTGYIEGTPNSNGFIALINQDGCCGDRFDRTDRAFGAWNDPSCGPDFNDDLVISNNCYVNDESFSELGVAYGGEVDPNALFGQECFRVCDYEVFKIVIE